MVCREVREGVKQLSESLCAAVERLANDLYESECHFLYEIIQSLGNPSFVGFVFFVWTSLFHVTLGAWPAHGTICQECRGCARTCPSQGEAPDAEASMEVPCNKQLRILGHQVHSNLSTEGRDDSLATLQRCNTHQLC